jgi:hypothetical protein
MGKYPTYPVLFDNCKALTISDLKRLGYLNKNQIAGGGISWNQGGQKTGSISIQVNTLKPQPYIEFDYQANGTPIKYRVNLTSKPSNLVDGYFYLFVCPITGKQCRKLYLVDGYFYSRWAFRGCMYEKQTHSHKTRQMLKAFELLTISDKLNAKHFRQSYSGQPTKKYLHLVRKFQISKIAFLQGLQD